MHSASAVGNQQCSRGSGSRCGALVVGVGCRACLKLPAVCLLHLLSHLPAALRAALCCPPATVPRDTVQLYQQLRESGLQYGPAFRCATAAGCPLLLCLPWTSGCSAHAGAV